MGAIYTGPVSPARRFLLYSALRVGLFAGAFAALLALQVNPFLAAALAAVIGLCVTYIFFRRQRDEVVRSVAAWRQADRGARDDDGDAEDDLLGESERERGGESQRVEQRGDAGELEREHELGSGATGEGDDRGGQGRQ